MTPLNKSEVSIIRELVSYLHELEPWGDQHTYSSTGWKALLHLAGRLQRERIDLVQLALRTFVSESSQDTLTAWGKVFLLLRVMFDTAHPLQPDAQIGQFTNWVRLGHNPKQSATWPIDWNSKSPMLISGCEGWIGPAYDYLAEYNFLLANYPFRRLSNG